MDKNLHPSIALVQPGATLPLISACEHFAGNEKFIRKAFDLQNTLQGSFDVTCDLEDGAATGSEHEYRMAFIDLINERHRQKIPGRVGVRIHEPSGNLWHSDLAAVMQGCGQLLDYIVVPKVRGVLEVRMVWSALKEFARTFSCIKLPTLHILIECPSALAHVQEIAAHTDVETLDFGLLDFISEHHGAISEAGMRSPAQFEHPLIRDAKIKISAAALGHGRVPSHNISVDVSDMNITASDAARARLDFGFLRMWSIHPSQVPVILKSFSLNAEELTKASEVLLAGYRASWGPIRYKTELHDRASYRHYWSLIQRTRMAGTALPQEVEQAFFME